MVGEILKPMKGMSGGNVNILMIEDNPGDIRLMDEALKEALSGSFTLVSAATLREGMARIGAATPDIVFLDLGLPDSQGIATAEKVCATFPRVPLVVLTGNHDDDLAVQALRCGAQDYLVKGQLDPILIQRTIRHCIERKRVENELEKKVEMLSALYSSLHRVQENLDLKTCGMALAKTAVDILGAEIAWIARILPDQRMETLASHPISIDCEHSGQHPWDAPIHPFCPLFLSVADHRPLIITDVRADRNLACGCQHLRTGQIVSVGAFPLISRERVFGVLALYSGQTNFFTPEIAEFFQTYANMAATLLDNFSLFTNTEKHLQQLSALRSIDQAIAGTQDLKVVLDLVLANTLAQLRVDAASILLMSPEHHMLSFASGIGFRTTGLRHSRLPVGEGLAGRAAKSGKLVHVPNLKETATSLRAASPHFQQEEFICYWGIPLIAKGRVQGVLELFHRLPLAPDREWYDFLEALAGQVAIAIDNATLFTDLQKANVDLLQSYEATLEGWARALDYRDSETEGHSRRVTETALRIAYDLGVPENSLVHIRRGALLHDIGKLGVPDSILLKPGPLDEDEWAIMKKHPTFAYEILSPIEFLRPALLIPYCHHEKWDGTGYPRGLSGTQIPLSARIFAVVDVWDALSSDRPYRKAWTREKTMAYLSSESGKHFDPAVVDAFIRYLEVPNP